MGGYGAICFGPINSRRFGLSLGLDLIGPNSPKQCNFDCVYCELPKGVKTSRINDYPGIDELLNALTQGLHAHPQSQVVTLCGNGEPTLRSDLLEIINKVRPLIENRPLLILSNGSTICNENVQNALLKCDIVKLSLDSAINDELKKIDRPQANFDIDKIIECMAKFRKIYSGKLVVEILLVKNINDSLQSATMLKKALETIKPDKIHLGTIARKPAYNVQAVDSLKLSEFAKALLPLEVSIA